MWDYCGMERSEEGLRKAIGQIRELKQEFRSDVKVLGTGDELNQALERAGRVADFFELGELMCIDALVRRESCGGHFRGGVADRRRRSDAERRRVRVRLGLGVRG
jgi:succinate dehydrogenase / fumarate reductase flavoprotein subunit